MPHLIRLALTAICVLLLANSPRDNFPRLKTIEAYAMGHEILMMPRYSHDGKVCEIGLERRHYTPGKVNLDSSLSRSEINAVFDELVPVNDRGKKLDDLEQGLIVQTGNSITTNIGYENVSLQIFSKQLSGSQPGEIVQADIVAIIHWKNRKCQ